MGDRIIEYGGHELFENIAISNGGSSIFVTNHIDGKLYFVHRTEHNDTLILRQTVDVDLDPLSLANASGSKGSADCHLRGYVRSQTSLQL